ncbi:MAG: tyrosine-protein phosphatase [Eubacteriaceae bacterium]|nr:tyrosine-protein phosphatase [Eubacteriaceae bacterium]MCL1913131.1 tyrosine-protein phosphatase [Eubacteriaceae bacterium]
MRDLGGYPTKYGTNTALGQFLRADNPSKLSADDLQRLYDYGVRLQIDFRSDSETEKAPSCLKGYKNVEFTNPQMLDDIHSADGSKEVRVTGTLGEMYCDFLDNKKGVYLRVLRDVLRHMDDCVFFNCTAGKDRTGTFAMILLKLAGVSDEDVVTDYKITGDNIWPDMKVLVEQAKAAGHDIDLDLVQSNPKHMEKALAHLKAEYGTIEHWLSIVGLSDAEINTLRDKVLGRF